ncbi:MAG: chloride channel protein [Planctomycetes bacterium]|nr:chloride channel protein [Planctomycetota bacterium]
MDKKTRRQIRERSSTTQRITAIDVKKLRKFDTGGIVAARAVENSRSLYLLSILLGLIVGVIGSFLFAGGYAIAAYFFGSIGGLEEVLTPAAELGSKGWLGKLLHKIPRSSSENHHYVWMLVALPVIGGLLVATWRWFRDDHSSYGAGEVVDAFHNKRGKVPFRATLDKFVGSVVTIGFGGSGGREGPISLIGASIGTFLSERFHLTVRERRILLAAGVAAGVGGMFRAPLAGGLLAAEFMYSEEDFEPDVLIPSILASVSSYCVFCLNYGWGSLFGRVAEGYEFANVFELVPMAALAVALVLGGYVLVNVNKHMGKVLHYLPRFFRPIAGMGFAGVLALLGYLFHGDEVLGVLGDGYVMLHHLFTGDEHFLSPTSISPNGWWIVLAFAGIKMLSSAATYMSGGGVGQFAPQMVIGGCIAAAVGLVFVAVFGSSDVPFLPNGGDPATVVGVYTIVGMAGFYAALAKAPVSTVIIVSELTGSYHLLLPALFVCALCFILSRGYRTYSAQVPTRKESGAHLGDFSVNVLKDIRVGDILDELRDYQVIASDTPLSDILHTKTTRQAYYPVVDHAERLIGIFSLNDLRGVLHDHEVWHLLVAVDIARTEFIKVTPDETLADVSYKFTDSNLDEFPVVSNEDPKELIGMISRRQLNNAYIKRTMHYDAAQMVERTRIGATFEFED